MGMTKRQVLREQLWDLAMPGSNQSVAERTSRIEEIIESVCRWPTSGRQTVNVRKKAQAKVDGGLTRR